MNKLKNEIKEFWSRYPCARNLIPYSEENKEFFQTHDRIIDRLTPYHPQVFQYELCQGKKVLEVGCGMGGHAWRFACYAKEFYALDLSPRSIELTKKRFNLYNLNADKIIVGDAENLPYPDNYFDCVFSNGVIHHSPDTQKAVDEIYRVLKPGGKATIMIYHKNSIFYRFDLMVTGRIKYALIKLMPRTFLKGIFKRKKSVDELKNTLMNTSWQEIGNLVLRFCDGYFNPHTKVYSKKEATELFNKFKNVSFEMRSFSDRLLEKVRYFEQHFGWGLFIYATK